MICAIGGEVPDQIPTGTSWNPITREFGTFPLLPPGWCAYIENGVRKYRCAEHRDDFDFGGAAM